MSVATSSFSIDIAERVVELSSTAELRGMAERIRDESLNESAPEGLRIHAALSFASHHARARRVLEDLAEQALDASIRCTAAQSTGNLPALSHLSARASDESIRRIAGHTLDLYGEINALLQVGKLRRARVRFDGRDAGILEELTKVGNGTRFRYDAAYEGPPIAPNMPPGKVYEDTDSLLPFFANLLPEGALYEQTARRLGVKRNDRLGVLLRVGADTMGAVEVLPMESA